MDIGQIYATATGGCVFVFILINFLPRTVRFKRKGLSLDVQIPDKSLFCPPPSASGLVEPKLCPYSANLYRTQRVLSGLPSPHQIQGRSTSREPVARQHNPAFCRRSSKFSGRPARISGKHISSRSPFGMSNIYYTSPLPRNRPTTRSNPVRSSGTKTSVWTDRTYSVAPCFLYH